MTNTYNTGNPLGSTDPRDLLDNASNLDDAMNSASATFTDRLGVIRDTWAGQENTFDLSQAGREAEFQQFLTDSGFVSLGNYAPGLNFTAYNQYMARDGFFYRPAPSSIPFTTTGTWVGGDEDLFNLFSADDVLRQDLGDDTDPDKGMGILGFDYSLAYPAGSAGAALAPIVDPATSTQSIPYEGRSQFSRNQDRPHVFDWIPVAEHAAIQDGTSVYDATADFQQAVDDVDSGTTIWLPARGTMNIAQVNVNKQGITFAGDNTGGGFAQASRIKCTLDGVPAFNVTMPQFGMRSVLLMGLSNITEKGADITQDAILLSAPTVSDNLDAVFESVGFLFFRDSIDMRGRNVKITSGIISNCRRGVSVHSLGIADVRGLEIYGTRFHSVGKPGNTDTACVVVDPAANFSELVMSGYVDDSVSVFRGFASNAVFDLPNIKARGTGYAIDSTGHGLGSDRRSFEVRGKYYPISPATEPGSALVATGVMQLEADMEVIGSGLHGIEINSPYSKVSGRVSNAGQATNNTYSALKIGAAAVGVTVNGLNILQGITGVPANLAKYGIENLGADTQFCGNNKLFGSYGTSSFFHDPTKYFGGESPARFVRNRIEWGTAAPTTGLRSQGDIVWHSNPVAAGFIGWVCVAGGTPGTWKTFGAITA